MTVLEKVYESLDLRDFRDIYNFLFVSHVSRYLKLNFQQKAIHLKQSTKLLRIYLLSRLYAKVVLVESLMIILQTQILKLRFYADYPV